MSQEKKKFFPKLSKKIKGFLTDESGKISKKDAFGLAAGALLLSGVEEINAAVTSHSNFTGFPPLSMPDVDGGGGHANVPYGPASKTYYSGCSHASGIVNGHYSSLPTGVGAQHANVTGHGSHGSHGSHCSCSRWG